MQPILIMNNPYVISMTANSTISNIDVGECILISVQLSWTGTSPVGSVQVQYSNDGTQWSNLGSAVSISGASGTSFVRDTTNPFCDYKYLQIAYTFTSGTGTLTAIVCGKRF